MAGPPIRTTSPSGTDRDSKMTATTTRAAIAPLPRPVTSIAPPTASTSAVPTLITSPVLSSRARVLPSLTACAEMSWMIR